MMRERSIFMAALDLDDPEARRRFVERSCGGDSALRGRVEALLDSHRDAGSFLQGDPAAEMPTETIDLTLEPPGEGVGSRIGPYKLLEAIGEGGMGTVYLAEQERPVHRMVALKVIKPGMDTRQVIARFEAERQALALMDHPNIARVLDGGATEHGRPYFVMELVRGVPITEFCDRERLGVGDRLTLFLKVCQAVQHAHQKGIIHRDLKPTNILVTMQDGVPMPKVIDFGIAKATGQRLTEKTLFTSFAQLVGTPQYMSPEQAEQSGVDIDTRSDIYSLGILLYELLTGSTPIDREEVRRVTLDQIRRLIREREPTKPSTKLSGLGPTLSTVSDARGGDPRRLMVAVRGDLDWIVMKCLEKDRNRRYETANALAADLRRHLDGEAVLACPPSATYRFGKFAGRNRAAIALVALAAGVLIAVAFGSSLAASRFRRLAVAEREARGRAVSAQAVADREAEAARLARGEADRRAAEAERAQADADRRAVEAQQVVDFLINDLIGSASPEQKRGEAVTVDDVLERADAGIAEKFGDQPLVEASIRLALGKTYEALGDYEKSREHLERAVALDSGHLGDEHVETIEARNACAWTLYRLGEQEEARALFEAELERARRVLGPEHAETLRAMNGLACTIEDQDRAIALHEELLEIRRRVHGPGSEQTCSSMNNLAVSLGQQRRFREAKQLYEEVVDLRTKDDPNDPLLLIAMGNLLNTYDSLGETPRDEFIERYKQLSETTERLLGYEHPRTLSTMNMTFWAILRGGRVDEARAFVEQARDRAERELGFEHDAAQWWYQKEINLMVTEKRTPREMLAFVEPYLDRVRTAFGPEAPETLAVLQTRANMLLSDHQWEEAEHQFRELEELYGRDPETSRGPLMEALLCRALIARNDGRPEDAESLIAGILGHTEDVDQLELAEMIARNRYGPGRADSGQAEPKTPLVIEAPFRPSSPVADGRIDPGEYGPAIDVEFSTDANPGRILDVIDLVDLFKTPEDLSYRVSAAHSEQSLFLAFEVRDQFIDDQEWDRLAVHQNDSVDLYINGDLVANDLIRGMTYRGNREGFQILCDAAGHRFSSGVDLTNDDWSAVARRTAGGYLVEFEVPLALIDTKDGPGSVPASTGSFLLINASVTDNDEVVTAQTTYATLWNEGKRRSVSLFVNGEDFWNVGLRLTPGP